MSVLPKPLVVAMLGRGYRRSDVARILGVSAERVRQIAARTGLVATHPPLTSTDDLPPDLRNAVLAWRHASARASGGHSG